MWQGKTIIIAPVTLVIGFASGFLLRPVILPLQQAHTMAAAPYAASAPSEARGTQYFVAHIDEARRVAAGCQYGSVRGGECATAEAAIVKIDARERRKQFLSNCPQRAGSIFRAAPTPRKPPVARHELC